MAITSGAKLGPYEIVGPLAAGGMGEVWRGRDVRLSREVAIKILPADVSGDGSRLRRFEKEARAASALNHPNIVTIYDVGLSDSVSWIAMECVEGKTLRDLLFPGALPVRKLLPLAAQIADGLAAAHEAGIVHRDLKPENVMVTPSGLVKILDFGLAKRTSHGSGSDEASRLPTETGTSPGMILGTVGYMSPEQASGQPVDFRSDQFAFGSILYEMATGKRAFQKSTAVDTLSAILHEEPKPVAEVNPQAPAPLRWIVERCLAKEPERRYASTLDLSRDLETLRDRSSEAAALTTASRRQPRRLAAWTVAVAAIALAATGLFAGRTLEKERAPSLPSFRRLTFRRGVIDAARFSSDGQTVVYSARWDGRPSHVFVTRLESAISTPLDIPDASLLSVSSAGDLTIAMGRPSILSWVVPGTIATVPMSGGTPRELATDVQWADSSSDGKRIAVFRKDRLEFPVGRAIYQARDGIAFLRTSPAGDRVAFVERGRIRVIDTDGREVFVSRKLGTHVSYAWRPSGDEIWYAEPFAASGVVHAVTLGGKERIALRIPNSLSVADISSDGRVLLAVGNQRWETWSGSTGQPGERDMTLSANSDAMGISPDGRTLLVNDGGSFYLRKNDGSSPKRLGEGIASELSSDGKWAVVVRAGPPPHLSLVPTGAGEEKVLESGDVEEFEWENVLRSADGRRLLFGGRERGGNRRMFVQDVAGGKPRALTPRDVVTESSSISPDGRFAVIEQEDGFWMYPMDGGEKRLVAGMLKTDFIWRNWSADGRFVYAWNPIELPFHVFRVELATGRREPWKTITPQDPAGIWSADLMMTPDGNSYAYNCKRALHDLYLVDGVK